MPFFSLLISVGQFSLLSEKPGADQNTGDDDLIFAASYHFNGGLDYAPIVERGFRKRVVARDGKPEFVDEPRWAAGA